MVPPRSFRGRQVGPHRLGGAWRPPTVHEGRAKTKNPQMGWDGPRSVGPRMGVVVVVVKRKKEEGKNRLYSFFLLLLFRLPAEEDAPASARGAGGGGALGYWEDYVDPPPLALPARWRVGKTPVADRGVDEWAKGRKRSTRWVRWRWC